MKIYKYEITFSGANICLVSHQVIDIWSFDSGGKVPSWVISTIEELEDLLHKCWELYVQGADIPIILTSKPFELLIKVTKRNAHESTFVKVVCKGPDGIRLSTDYGVN